MKLLTTFREVYQDALTTLPGQKILLSTKYFIAVIFERLEAFNP